MENLGNEKNKEEILNKWAPIIGTASDSKLDWLSQYTAAHSASESINGHTLWGEIAATQSSSYPSLLPLAVQVVSKTVASNLVTVNCCKPRKTNK